MRNKYTIAVIIAALALPAAVLKADDFNLQMTKTSNTQVKVIGWTTKTTVNHRFVFFGPEPTPSVHTVPLNTKASYSGGTLPMGYMTFTESSGGAGGGGGNKEHGPVPNPGTDGNVQVLVQENGGPNAGHFAVYRANVPFANGFVTVSHDGIGGGYSVTSFAVTVGGATIQTNGSSLSLLIDWFSDSNKGH